MLLATFIAVPHSKAVVSQEIEDYSKSSISGRCVDSGFCGIMDGNKIVFGHGESEIHIKQELVA